MIYYEDYLISSIHLSDGSSFENSLFSYNKEEDFNFYKEVSVPFKGLKLMNRRKIRDTKKISMEKDDYIMEEEVIAAVPWSQIVCLHFGEISELDKDTLKLLGIEEEETIDLDVG